MTTPIEAEQLILDRWVTEWGTTTPFTFEEEQIPVGVDVGETSWVYLFIQDIKSDQINLGAIGGRRYLRKAQVQIYIFTPANQGTAEALSLAQQAREVYEGIRLEPLKNFLEGQIVRVGPKPPEFQVNVLCPFEYTETK